ncbi:MAG: sensor histidine kinase [Kofleriaceae bacterium]|nr:sensor histidine kinase [Kofleriaceae bacterium]
MTNVRESRVLEAEEQSRRLQSVAAKVAHELKNPLASIKGLCQLIAKAPAHARTGERLAVVESEIVRMEHLLAEYLSFARPLEDLRLQHIDVADVARDVVEVLDGRAATAGIALILTPNAAPLAADPRRLREALLNLMGNALEATAAGGTISLTTRSNGNDIVIEVVDTGRGIRPEDLARMGTSFFTTRPDGTGLGVVLAMSAITQHGGTLRYRSEVGAGTTATIRLPRSEVVA